MLGIMLSTAMLMQASAASAEFEAKATERERNCVRIDNAGLDLKFIDGLIARKAYVDATVQALIALRHFGDYYSPSVADDTSLKLDAAEGLAKEHRFQDSATTMRNFLSSRRAILAHDVRCPAPTHFLPRLPPRKK